MSDQNRKDRPPQAAICLPADPGRSLHICTTWCDQHGYAIAAVINNLDTANWIDVVRMMATGAVDVVVVADRSHLPAGRIPRIEVAEAPQSSIPRQRRPRTLRDRQK